MELKDIDEDKIQQLNGMNSLISSYGILNV